MAKPLSLGFVGGSPNSAVGYAHFVASRMDGLWSLQAGAFSRQAKVNEQAAQCYGLDPKRAYTNLDVLLQHEAKNLDAVVLLTPTPWHREMAVTCLQAGMPVICEKALATSSVEAAEICAACATHKGFLAVIYNYSGYPMVRELRAMISEGVLGEILHFQAEMPQEGYLRVDAQGNIPQVQSWRLVDGVIPTLYLDLAVHLHELIYYLIGEKPIEVMADQASRGWFGVIDNVIGLARYANNVQGQFWFSKSALGARNGLRLRIYGSKASAQWYQMNPEEILLAYDDGRVQLLDRASNTKIASQPRYNRFKAGHPAGFNEALANLYVDIHAALTGFQASHRQDSEEVFGVELGFEGLCFLDAMVKSCHTRKWEAVRVGM